MLTENWYSPWYLPVEETAVGLPPDSHLANAAQLSESASPPAVTGLPVAGAEGVFTTAGRVLVPTLRTSSTGSPVTAGGDADSLNWAALAACESGGNPSAVSSTGKYHGLYQFSVGTWQAVGGTGLPSDASAEEQTARAKMLYNRSGAGQWPHCGKNLFS